MFYDRFLELCAEKGLKPTNACVEAGLSRGLAAKWKSTKTEKPSAEALEKMSAYFGKSIDEILDRKKAAGAEAPAAADLNQLLPGWSELTEANKARLLDYAALLLKSQQGG